MVVLVVLVAVVAVVVVVVVGEGDGAGAEKGMKHGVYGGGAVAAAPTLVEFLNSRQSTHYSDTEFCVF